MMPVAPSQFHRSLILGFPRAFKLGSGIQQQLYHINATMLRSSFQSRSSLLLCCRGIYIRAIVE
jgi:hypothetical protein